MISAAMAAGQRGEIFLKALVFADSCDNSAAAVFSAKSYLHSKPVLVWQLSTLARYGVKEAIVLSAKPIDVQYTDPLHRLKIIKLSSPSWRGEGDALREIESRTDIRPQDDFLVVRSGSIFNINVSKLVAQHKARKAKDRNWLLTSVLRRGTSGASTSVVVAVESESGTILKYSDRCTTGVSIDVKSSSAALDQGGAVEIASNVVDTGLDVCSPEMLLEFKENFDFSCVRSLTKEKLDSGDAETLGNRMFAHFTNSSAGEYAARIDSLASLAQVTKDVFNGWMLPISLGNISAPKQVHNFKGDVFICPSLDADCKTKKSAQSFNNGSWSGRNCVVGLKTQICASSQIENSVIGDNVVIGEGCGIKNSIILNNVTVGSYAMIEDSIVSEKCVVRKGANVPQNCLLDEGVIIGEDFQGMHARSLISVRSRKDFDSEEDDEEGEEDVNGLADSLEHTHVHESQANRSWRVDDVGLDGAGYIVYAPLPKCDPFFSSQCASFFLGVDGSDEEDELEESDHDLEDNQFAQNGEWESANNLDMLPLSVTDSTIKFHREVYELLERSWLDNVDISNTILEANSLRFSFDVTSSEFIAAIADGAARNAIADCESRGDRNVYAAFLDCIEKIKPIVESYVETADELRDFKVTATLSLLYENEGSYFLQLLVVLYNQDIIEREGICLWASKEQAAIASGQRQNSPFADVKPFVDRLAGEDEDEDE